MKKITDFHHDRGRSLLVVIGGIVAVAIFVLAVVILFPNDERAIRKQLEKIASNASVDAKQSFLSRQLQNGRLADSFAPEILVHFRDAGQGEAIRGRSDLMEYIAAARATLQETRFHFSDIQVQLTNEKSVADVRAVLHGDINGGASSIDEPIQMGFSKIENHWIITKIEASGVPSLPAK